MPGTSLVLLGSRCQTRCIAKGTDYCLPATNFLDTTGFFLEIRHSFIPLSGYSSLFPRSKIPIPEWFAISHLILKGQRTTLSNCQCQIKSLKACYVYTSFQVWLGVSGYWMSAWKSPSFNHHVWFWEPRQPEDRVAGNYWGRDRQAWRRLWGHLIWLLTLLQQGTNGGWENEKGTYCRFEWSMMWSYGKEKGGGRKLLTVWEVH